MSLKIACTSIDTTSKKKTTLGCNGNIYETYHKIDSNIEINAIRLRQKKHEIWIISVDTLFVTNEIKQLVVGYLHTKIDIQDDQVFICASHTHYAPFLDKSKPKLGSVDLYYYTYFKKQLFIVLDQLLKKPLIDINISYKELETTGISVNRRKLSWGIWKRYILKKSLRIFPNPNEPIDSKVRVFKFTERNTNKHLAIMWNFACHPVMYHTPMNLSAHFPGDIRAQIRDELGNIPVVFLQGFSGDVRPNNIGKDQSVTGKILSFLNKSPEFQQFNYKTYQKWIDKLGNVVKECLSKSGEMILNTNLTVAHSMVPLNKCVSKGNGQINFQTIELSNNYVIVGVSAEVVSSYSLKLQQIYPKKTIIPVGCMGTVFGYWPTQKMLTEGGYEVNGFKSFFSLNGKFIKASIESVFFKAIEEIDKKEEKIF